MNVAMACRISLVAFILGRKMSKLSIRSSNMVCHPKTLGEINRRWLIPPHRDPEKPDRFLLTFQRGFFPEQRHQLLPQGVPHLPEGG